ncbi:hypothetical protein H6P81_010938 [Aristolochia fimbriata]|uniref:Uncharacterized protein n=1 Tax=Aristolochia fimbriata TaxID=158543 RepID=A0AAV7EQH6_ARIFI|nr:hypothetical protein H6P81_010938 [Aristolochia fimbriata]
MASLVEDRIYSRGRRRSEVNLSPADQSSLLLDPFSSGTTKEVQCNGRRACLGLLQGFGTLRLMLHGACCEAHAVLEDDLSGIRSGNPQMGSDLNVAYSTVALPLSAIRQIKSKIGGDIEKTNPLNYVLKTKETSYKKKKKFNVILSHRHSTQIVAEDKRT